MCSEYRAVIIMLSPIKIIVGLDQENNDMVISSSPIRLIEGGRAKLARLAVNHQIDISGRIVCRLRASIMVRLWTRS